MMNEHEIALDAIRKKLVGKTLTYKEIYAVMDEIAHRRMGDILTTYFAASGYSNGFSTEELYHLTKAMVATGEKLEFPGIVADKHSIGGVPGTRTSLIVVPLVAAAGFTIPKSSSRAITTPDGTADDMEVLSRVSFTKQEIYEIVKKTNACIVWGGSVNIAPADDVLIHVEKPLMFESFDKVVVSIMAKKIAFGSNHIVIDLPFGDYVKVHDKKDAAILARKFENIADRFGIRIKVLQHETSQPTGQGIGPVLECIDALKVLEQTPDRPLDLEERALFLATELLQMCLEDSREHERNHIKELFGTAGNWARHILQSGAARDKMKAIIKAQGGNEHRTHRDLKVGRFRHEVISHRSGTITQVNSIQATAIAKVLGAPSQKGSGIFLNKKIGDEVKKGETIYTLYSQSMYNMEEAKETLSHAPIVTL